ncbi:MAG: hypothetical protein WDA28_05650, partial [Castellaniella sp.]
MIAPDLAQAAHPDAADKPALAMLWATHVQQTENFSYVSFDDLKRLAQDPQTIEAADPKAAKRKAPAIAPHDGPAKTKEAALAHDRYTMLWADIDSGNPALSDIQARLQEHGIDSYVIYSTGNSTPKDHRWRVLIELSHACAFDQWHAMQEYLVHCFGGDPSAHRAQQVLYAPFVMPQTAGYYSHAIGEGEPLDPRTASLAEAAARYREQMEHKALQEAASASPAPRQCGPLQDGQQSPIELYNEAYSIDALLGHYGYKQVGKRWMHPASESKEPGVVILDGKYYSHHGSDPLADGHTHDAFDLYVHFEHGGDMAAAVRQAARDLCPQWQKQRQRDYRQQQAAAESEPLYQGTPLQPVSIADLLTNPPKPPRFIWGELVPRGVVTLFAA